MADKSRERNSVDMFSNYGLDERQREISAKLGFRCFRMLYLGALVLTGVWYLVYNAGSQMPYMYVAVSYLALAMLVYCIYAVYASKYGVINGISAFSFTVTERNTAIVCIIGAIILPFTSLFEDPWLLSVVLVLAAIKSIVLYFCGKRNFKVLDEQMKEDEEDE
ncbi:MAG: hypothetical protein IJC04_05385 [Oscillospiraceae bacterium]|nr:hypothetical protein [Oscillospiraceae bacterium]